MLNYDSDQEEQARLQQIFLLRLLDSLNDDQQFFKELEQLPNHENDFLVAYSTEEDNHSSDLGSSFNSEEETETAFEFSGKVDVYQRLKIAQSFAAALLHAANEADLDAADNLMNYYINYDYDQEKFFFLAKTTLPQHSSVFSILNNGGYYLLALLGISADSFPRLATFFNTFPQHANATIVHTLEPLYEHKIELEKLQPLVENLLAFAFSKDRTQSEKYLTAVCNLLSKCLPKNDKLNDASLFNEKTTKTHHHPQLASDSESPLRNSSFFSPRMSPPLAATANRECLKIKIEQILALPWCQASRFNKKERPTSIKKMDAQIKQLNPETALKNLASFCTKQAKASPFYRKIRGRHDLTHEFITILAQLNKLSATDMITQLTGLEDKFRIHFGLPKNTEPAPITVPI